MARVNAQEYAEKWSRRLKSSTEDIRRGIGKVSEAPGIAAARQQNLMKSNLNKSIDDGTWAAQVSSVPLQEWKDAAGKKGVDRIAAGVDAAAPKQAAMATSLLANVDASVAEANAIPRGTLEDNINRMTTFVRGMAKRRIRGAR
jgi:hypothetical protein